MEGALAAAPAPAAPYAAPAPDQANINGKINKNVYTNISLIIN